MNKNECKWVNRRHTLQKRNMVVCLPWKAELSKCEMELNNDGHQPRHCRHQGNTPRVKDSSERGLVQEWGTNWVTDGDLSSLFCSFFSCSCQDHIKTQGHASLHLEYSIYKMYYILFLSKFLVFFCSKLIYKWQQKISDVYISHLMQISMLSQSHRHTFALDRHVSAHSARH